MASVSKAPISAVVGNYSTAGIAHFDSTAGRLLILGGIVWLGVTLAHRANRLAHIEMEVIDDGLDSSDQVVMVRATSKMSVRPAWHLFMTPLVLVLLGLCFIKQLGILVGMFGILVVSMIAVVPTWLMFAVLCLATAGLLWNATSLRRAVR